jgi:hypothetical protein
VLQLILPFFQSPSEWAEEGQIMAESWLFAKFRTRPDKRGERCAGRIIGAPELRIFQVLHLAALGYCGDRWSDLRRWLKEHKEEEAIPPSVAGASWDTRCR